MSREIFVTNMPDGLTKSIVPVIERILYHTVVHDNDSIFANDNAANVPILISQKYVEIWRIF